MLTVEQVKTHSEVFLRYGLLKEDYITYTARLLYLHNGRLSRLKIRGQLLESLPKSDIKEQMEENVKAIIDWEKFTDWVNRHDDLMESNLMTRSEWSAHNVKHHKSHEIGRHVSLIPYRIRL